MWKLIFHAFKYYAYCDTNDGWLGVLKEQKGLFHRDAAVLGNDGLQRTYHFMNSTNRSPRPAILYDTALVDVEHHHGALHEVALRDFGVQGLKRLLREPRVVALRNKPQLFSDMAGVTAILLMSTFLLKSNPRFVQQYIAGFLFQERMQVK